MMRTRTFVLLFAFAATGLIAAGGVRLGQQAPARPDCPGKIVCPLTGEEVCRDLCPTVDPHRPDCPGRIVCPLTGELVCRDRCPLGKTERPGQTTNGSEALPPCCAQAG